MPGNVTSLLNRWRDGDSEAFQQMIPIVYQELRAIAEGYIRRERSEHTLQPTVLVHELYLKLVHQRHAECNDREHFFAFAARLMRFLLIDHARSMKRKGDRGEAVTPLHEDLPWLDTQSEEMIHLEVVLDELESIDPSKLRMVEIRYFLGCTAQETADLLKRLAVHRKS